MMVLDMGTLAPARGAPLPAAGAPGAAPPVERYRYTSILNNNILVDLPTLSTLMTSSFQGQHIIYVLPYCLIKFFPSMSMSHHI